MNISKKLLAFVAITSLVGSQLYSADTDVAIGEGNIKVEPVKVMSNEIRIELRTELELIAQKVRAFIPMFENAADKTKKLTKKAAYKNIVKLLEKMTKNAKKASDELEKYKVNAAVDVNQSITTGGVCVEVKPSETPNGQIETEVKKEESKKADETTAVIAVQPEGNKVVLTTAEDEQKAAEELKKAVAEKVKAEEAQKTVEELKEMQTKSVVRKTTPGRSRSANVSPTTGRSRSSSAVSGRSRSTGTTSSIR